MKKLSFLALLLSSSVFAEEAAQPTQSNFMQIFIILGVAIVFFYLLIWRPEKKRRKAMEERRNAIKKGDKVTAMGIIGIVEKVLDDTVIIKMYDNTKLEFLKGAVSEIHSATVKEQKPEPTKS